MAGPRLTALGQRRRALVGRRQARNAGASQGAPSPKAAPPAAEDATSPCSEGVAADVWELSAPPQPSEELAAADVPAGGARASQTTQEAPSDEDSEPEEQQELSAVLDC